MGGYPELTRRYMASFTDGMLVLTVAIAVAGALQGERVAGLRVALILLIVFSYEPVLTSQFCTAGQFAMQIRVRRHDNVGERIGLGAAYLRFVFKILFGFYSFFTIGFNPERRAAHDFAAGSIVVDASSR